MLRSRRACPRMRAAILCRVGLALTLLGSPALARWAGAPPPDPPVFAAAPRPAEVGRDAGARPTGSGCAIRRRLASAPRPLASRRRRQARLGAPGWQALGHPPRSLAT